MSLPPQEGGMSFPMIWGKTQARSVSAAEPPAMQFPSDDEIMARLRANDSDALAIIFDRYSRLVLGVAFRILRDRGEAEEVVQEAFLQVFQKANLFDPSRGSAKVWIVTIAYHRALDRKSYLSRRGFYHAEEIDYLTNASSDGSNLDRGIMAKLSRVQLEKAFQELPDIQRRTLEMYYFEGLDIREIIARLEEPWGNVRHHLYRGLERLRKSAFVQGLRES